MAKERSERAKVRVLIENATNSTDSKVDPRLLKAIKSVVRSSDSELRVAAQVLMDLMWRLILRISGGAIINLIRQETKVVITIKVDNSKNSDDS